jgi:hypothetical protein
VLVIAGLPLFPRSGRLLFFRMESDPVMHFCDHKPFDMTVISCLGSETWWTPPILALWITIMTSAQEDTTCGTKAMVVRHQMLLFPEQMS